MVMQLLQIYRIFYLVEQGKNVNYSKLFHKNVEKHVDPKEQ